MSNSTPTHSPKLISKRKKEKKNRERKELRDWTCCPRRERERERERSEGTEDRGHDVDVRARWSARSNFDEG